MKLIEIHMKTNKITFTPALAFVTHPIVTFTVAVGLDTVMKTL